jgi:chemotaxis family two-component system response regulator Rcp1
MAGTSSQTPARILLGEDNPADVYLIRQALEENGIHYKLTVAVHGGEILEVVTSSGSEIPDLIVLDLNLPRHEGLEILKFIRESPELERVPVVILTSSDSPKDRLAASQLGASCYIRKPSNLDEFMDIGKTFHNLLADRDNPRIQ